MLFRRPVHSQEVLRRALRAAIAAHKPQVLQHLLASHGAPAVAAALADGSGRMIADALSMLPAAERGHVAGRLPHGPARLSSAPGIIHKLLMK